MFTQDRRRKHSRASIVNIKYVYVICLYIYGSQVQLRTRKYSTYPPVHVYSRLSIGFWWISNPVLWVL
jgi:hypothetical protein